MAARMAEPVNLEITGVTENATSRIEHVTEVSRGPSDPGCERELLHKYAALANVVGVATPDLTRRYAQGRGRCGECE